MKSLGEEFKERKNELGITTEQLSRLSGIPTGTINKILNGETKSPRYATLKALNDVLFRDIDSGIDGIRETAAAYTLHRHSISQFLCLCDIIYCFFR